ncbi:MAG: glycosyl transferase family 1, partial [Thermotoga sp.]
NVIDYYPIIDVLLLSSVSEGQPLVILEAMAAGIPVVATNVGACQEMILGESKQCGFIVNPKDHTKIAESIKKLYSDREMTEQFSKNGKEIVRRKYTLEKMIKSYRRLYEDVLNL